MCICRIVHVSSYKNYALCCRIQVSNVRSLQHPSCWERHSAFYFYVVCYKNNASFSRTILWTKKILTHEFSYSSFPFLQKGVNWSNDTVVPKTLIFADKKENNEMWQIQLSKDSPNCKFRFELIKYEKLLQICVAFIFLRLVHVDKSTKKIKIFWEMNHIRNLC